MQRSKSRCGEPYATRERLCDVRRRAGRCVSLRLGCLLDNPLPSVATAIAPRISGFSPNTRPNTAPAANASAGASHLLPIMLKLHCRTSTGNAGAPGQFRINLAA